MVEVESKFSLFRAAKVVRDTEDDREVEDVSETLSTDDSGVGRAEVAIMV